LLILSSKEKDKIKNKSMKGGIKEILKQLTPEKVKSENKKILKIKLPPEIEKWVKEYEKVGKRNNYKNTIG